MRFFSHPRYPGFHLLGRRKEASDRAGSPFLGLTSSGLHLPFVKRLAHTTAWCSWSESQRSCWSSLSKSLLPRTLPPFFPSILAYSSCRDLWCSSSCPLHFIFPRSPSAQSCFCILLWLRYFWSFQFSSWLKYLCPFLPLRQNSQAWHFANPMKFYYFGLCQSPRLFCFECFEEALSGMMFFLRTKPRVLSHREAIGFFCALGNSKRSDCQLSVMPWRDWALLFSVSISQWPSGSFGR